ncbi:DUF2004 domain-containing protein [Kitasatospora sp. NPDC004531]
MSHLDHPRFGRLDAGARHDTDLLWQGAARLGDRTVPVLLWAGPSSTPTAEDLDALAASLADLPALDTTARTALCAHLHEDREFLDFHLEELPDSEPVRHLRHDSPAQEVVAAMHLTTVTLWLPAPSAHPPVVLDYTFDPDLSDQILAVKLTHDATVTAIDWES